MDISINEQNQNHIRRKVESGQYGSPDEVVDMALRLLDERDKKLEALRRDIQEGLNSGPGKPIDEHTADNIIARGQERLAQRQPTD